MTKPISLTAILEVLKKFLPPGDPLDAGRIRKVLIAGLNSRESHAIEQSIKSFLPDAIIRFAAGGIETCTLLAGFLPELLVLDAAITAIDPLAMLDHLKGHKRYGSIRTIVATDLNQNDPKMIAMRAAGCNYLLQRPLDAPGLTSALEKVVSGPRQKGQEPSKKAWTSIPANAQTADAPDTHPVLDPARLLETFQGDMAMLADYIAIFMQDLPDVIRELEAAIDGGLMDTVEHQAHKVKNIAAESGGMRLCLLAAAMEKAAVEGRRQFCEQQLSRLKAEFDSLVDAIHAQGW